MREVPLSDGSGNWFDLDDCREWQEHVSPEEMQQRGFYPDGTYAWGETLYYTRKCNFVLCRWTRDFETRYVPMELEAAARWLIANGYQKDVQQLEFQFEKRELEV